MFFTTRPTRRKPIRSAVASFALAVALVGGVGVASTAATSEAANAQELPDPSDGFREAYAPAVPLVQAETANYEAARAMIPTILAAIENNRDRDIAGNLILNIGTSLSDRQLQRQGILLRLESGLLPAEQVGLFNWYAGNFAFEVDDYAAARQNLMAAMAAGYVPEGSDIVGLIARSYTDAEDDAGAYNYISGVIAEANAAGTPVREAWLRNKLQYEYENEMSAEALTSVLQLVDNYPAQRSWQDGLRIMSQTLELSDGALVDLYRLMALNGALIDRVDIVDYIETVDPRILPVEALSALETGLAQGVFTSGDSYYVEVRNIANSRASADRSELEDIVSEGRSGDGLDAKNAGGILFSMQDYVRSEEMYTLALERGFDPEGARMAIGINQAMQGNNAEAIATFAAIQGERAPIAALWTQYVEGRSSM